MAFSKATFYKFTSVGLGVFILIFLLYPISLPVMDYKKVLSSWEPPPVKTPPPPLGWSNPVFSNIEKRIKQDKQNIDALCQNYLFSSQPFVTVKINNQPIQIQNYYMNKEKKLGWCINAKVRRKICKK